MLTLDTITGLAPDQSSLTAASKLTKASKWPERALDPQGSLVWGACQGSGANPYRVVFDKNDHGYKCTCPSRKFPCKHVLAIMWMYAEDPGGFTEGVIPEWVNDWLGRRRSGGGAKTPEPTQAGKSLTLAQAEAAAPAKAPDPKAEARRKAAAEKRAAQTEAALLGAMDELETWVADQLRTGLAGLLKDLTPRCRAIAARMVDGKAAALGSRLDELPASLMEVEPNRRLDLLLQELSRMVLLARAFRADPKAPGPRRAVASAENREALLENTEALRCRAPWEVVGEQITTRRDGNVSQATWLMNLGEGPSWALLLDFFPAATGHRGSPFAPGEQFEAELVFYPGPAPLRAVIADRKPLAGPRPWPVVPQNPFDPLVDRLGQAPWEGAQPLLLPAGQLAQSRSGETWWRGAEGMALPIRGIVEEVTYGMALNHMVGIWDGETLAPLSGHAEDWGRVTFHA